MTTSLVMTKAEIEKYVKYRAEKCEKELRKSWRSNAMFKRQVHFAYVAFKAFARKSDLKRIDEIGNNPVMIRILASVGRELHDDQPPSTLPPAIEAMMKDPAYFDVKHKRHKAVFRKVENYFKSVA